MSGGRLTIRFNAVYCDWIAGLSTDKADAVRALMVLGAATLDLPGAAREAMRLLDADLTTELADAILGLADKRQTSGRQAADSTPDRLLPAKETTVTTAGNERNGWMEPVDDLLVGIGIEV